MLLLLDAAGCGWKKVKQQEKYYPPRGVSSMKGILHLRNVETDHSFPSICKSDHKRPLQVLRSFYVSRQINPAPLIADAIHRKHARSATQKAPRDEPNEKR